MALPIDEKDIKHLAKQAALINTIDLKPPHRYDSWAIVNFLKEFEKKHKYISSKDMKLIEPLREEFKKLQIEKLPHCFFHGDIIKTNTIKDKEGRIWILDFSVSNYYPRIQELAVMACDLLLGDTKEESENNLQIALSEYQKVIKLTGQELRALPTHIKLAHAMHIMSPPYETAVNNNTSEENDYFLEIGRKGLKQTSE